MRLSVVLLEVKGSIESVRSSRPAACVASIRHSVSQYLRGFVYGSRRATEVGVEGGIAVFDLSLLFLPFAGI